ncbi:MAG TPA: CocE/NonD family hydrolase [Fodinibius sp.]|nr:CocE/NonD family hydrolase [Fodinibius sp.]
MKKYSALLVFLLVLVSTSAAQDTTASFSAGDYIKQEADIEMRDGVKLHTVIYRPDSSTQALPLLMKRTPYSCRPYGEDTMPRRIHSNPQMVKEGYIFICQDVRGRWMSEGQYTTMTPNIPGPEGIDESSDTYDTIEWLLENIPNNNGKVGQYGISYPGFYTSAALPNAHPALVASSPQAPIADFFFDDFRHHGAYLMSYWYATNVFGYQHDGPTPTPWYSLPEISTKDAYWFYLNKLEPLSKASKYYKEDNFFWQELVNNPNYNEFWQSRNILPHLRNIDHSVLVVGGWFDAEDLYGPLNTYKTIERENPEAKNSIVMGPWSHGDWAGADGPQLVGDIYFGDNLSAFYKKNIEAPFFSANLKGDGSANLPEAYMFDTGRKEWTKFNHWPPEQAEQQQWYVHNDGSLNTNKPSDKEKEYSEYISDLSNPVPYIAKPKLRFTPRPFMTSDQRFAARRPDVVTFETGVLEEAVTISGEILANLYVSTSGTASDWIVKLIDVYPPSVKKGEHTPEGVMLDNYHQMVRSEVIRGRFRNSYENPEPFEPGKVTYIDLPLQDVYHTFKKGHKIQVQIQSTFFPYIDLNPQKYVENIFKADSSDFQNTIQRIYHTPGHPTSVEMDVLR